MSRLAVAESYVDFGHWTGDRELATIGTNAGSQTLAFQGWRSFKEAFAPELVRRAVEETGQVGAVLDPFGGSGTTALACQFLGVRPTTIEVNPFLADLIEAKVCAYDAEVLVREYARVVEAARGQMVDPQPWFAAAPKTFLEPGVNGRYLFSTAVAGRLCAYRQAIEATENPAARRLFKVMLAAVAVPVSNAVVSGKGRRYRRNWKERTAAATAVDDLFDRGVLSALFDLRRFEARRCREFTLLRGDSRERLDEVGPIDLSIFSPPYPNSFDYTDVYNIELWALGYLASAGDNRSLRKATLRSHVQIKRDMSCRQARIGLLDETLGALEAVQGELWNSHIPEMVGAYFDDMHVVLNKVRSRLRAGGRVYMVVGDSRYAGVDVPVCRILCERAPELGYQVISAEPFRSMRASPQQGGRHELAESLIILGA